MNYFSKIIFALFLVGCLTASDTSAQRMGHAGSRGGGASSANRGSINGGASRSQTRPQSGQYDRSNRASTARTPSTADRSRQTSPSRNDRPNSGGGTRPNNGNNRNVNININNNVRINNSHNNRYYHGHRGYYPYRYHRYSPYLYGAFWHPVGFFVAVVATTAILVSISNQYYYYDQGVYYSQVTDGYTVVSAPVNIVVVEIPDGFESVRALLGARRRFARDEKRLHSKAGSKQRALVVSEYREVFGPQCGSLETN
jgi:hypothetical protein